MGTGVGAGPYFQIFFFSLPARNKYEYIRMPERIPTVHLMNHGIVSEGDMKPSIAPATNSQGTAPLNSLTDFCAAIISASRRRINPGRRIAQPSISPARAGHAFWLPRPRHPAQGCPGPTRRAAKRSPGRGTHPERRGQAAQGHARGSAATHRPRHRHLLRRLAGSNALQGLSGDDYGGA